MNERKKERESKYVFSSIEFTNYIMKYLCKPKQTNNEQSEETNKRE